MPDIEEHFLGLDDPPSEVPEPVEVSALLRPENRKKTLLELISEKKLCLVKVN
jgi:hypothetical protein